MDYSGFRFGNVHSKDLGLLVVSSSDRYDKNLLPNPTDYSAEIPGSDGQYYYGSTFANREFTLDIAFDSVDEKTWRRISQLFATDKLQDLVFDELPYKTYRAKLSSKPEFKVIGFYDKDTKKRIYKGEGTLNFICYFPYAYGFNKYVVRAADYYKTTFPEKIITEYYEKENLGRPLPELIKDHYNIKENNNRPWKGGYPTIEQVQAGELFFDTPDGKKSLIDVRNYWDNVPLWEDTAKLLTTPTLDYEQELMFMPQFSKVNFMNLDTGFYKDNDVMGSRLLVYNPGDIAVDWEIKLDVNKRGFWTGRGGNGFRVQRFNVERLTIPQAVEWTNLRAVIPEEDAPYKFGDKYFKLANIEEDNDALKSLSNKINKKWKEGDYNYYKEDGTWYKDGVERDADKVAYNLNLKQVSFNEILDSANTDLTNLDFAHPHHCYIAEPIPKERLGHYIKLFYWQTEHLSQKKDKGFLNNNITLSFEDGIKFANRYEELYSLCIDEEEKEELYWKTLREVIFEPYRKLKIFSKQNLNKNEEKYYQDENITFEKFVDDYLYNPMEFILGNSDKDLDYDEVEFNLYRYPDWITEDYFEIDQSLFEHNEDDLSSPIGTGKDTNGEVFLNTEIRLLFANQNPDSDLYHYKPKKISYNDSITKGKWFKLPPGWSLIVVEPVSDEYSWGGKRWLDARPFDWGYGGDINANPREAQQLFDVFYNHSVKTFLNNENQLLRAVNWNFNRDNIAEYIAKGFLNDKFLFDEEIKGKNEDSVKNEIINKDEILIKFRLWYMFYLDYFKDVDNFNYGLYKRLECKAEYSFLKYMFKRYPSVAKYFSWTVGHGVELDKNDLDFNGLPKRCINGENTDWFWYACNYIWANFPPLYYASVDMLNKIQIKYIPLFY